MLIKDFMISHNFYPNTDGFALFNIEGYDMYSCHYVINDDDGAQAVILSKFIGSKREIEIVKEYTVITFKLTEFYPKPFSFRHSIYCRLVPDDPQLDGRYDKLKPIKLDEN